MLAIHHLIACLLPVIRYVYPQHIAVDRILSDYTVFPVEVALQKIDCQRLQISITVYDGTNALADIVVDRKDKLLGLEETFLTCVFLFSAVNKVIVEVFSIMLQMEHFLLQRNACFGVVICIGIKALTVAILEIQQLVQHAAQLRIFVQQFIAVNAGIERLELIIIIARLIGEECAQGAREDQRILQNTSLLQQIEGIVRRVAAARQRIIQCIGQLVIQQLIERAAFCLYPRIGCCCVKLLCIDKRDDIFTKNSFVLRRQCRFRNGQRLFRHRLHRLGSKFPASP